jgi:hypothetical protein
MYPTEDGEGWCYLAEGTWDLMGNAPVGPMLGQPEDGRFEMVAGVDLNHRPLGYEFKGKLVPNNLHAHG